MNEWDYSEFWNETIRQLRKKLTELEFKMWFDIEYQNSREDVIVVSVPSSFYRDQIIGKGFKDQIEETLEDLSGKKIKLEIEIRSKKTKSVSPAEKETSSKAEKTQSPVSSRSPEAPAPEKEKRGQHPLLKPEYTFDNFVEGDLNAFAKNASIAVARNPGKSYNPLILYGASGLGKTHLMEAIGNEAWQNIGCNIIYVTAEEFLNEFVEMVKDQKMKEFKNKYRKADILLIDDIHFFQGKESCQEELFHTFNALDQAGKQIVFTCDRPVTELSKLHERIRSRCEKGLNVDLQPPDFETRCAILRKKLTAKNDEIPNDVITLIAEKVSTNVRDLEGCLTKIIAYADFKKIPVTVEIASTLLKDNFTSTTKKNITVDSIQKAVASYFAISTTDLKGKKRSQSVTLPRHIAMYLCRNMTEFSTTEIALEFGGRDHTTVIHASQKIDDRIKSEPSLENTILEIKKAIFNSN